MVGLLELTSNMTSIEKCVFKSFASFSTLSYGLLFKIAVLLEHHY